MVRRAARTQHRCHGRGTNQEHELEKSGRNQPNKPKLLTDVLVDGNACATMPGVLLCPLVIFFGVGGLESFFGRNPVMESSF